MAAMTTIVGQNATVEFAGASIVNVGAGNNNSDAVLLPGFIDLQVNGIGDVDFGIADDQHAISTALDAMAALGTTSCVPTVVTAPLDAYDATLERIRRARDLPDASTRCSILGVHLEGPFLGGAPGAHPQHLIRSMDLAWLQSLLDRHGDLIKMVTLAPEADPNFAGIKMLAARGVLVAIGHSDCSYETATAAVDAGARVATHLYNAMSGLHHRTPGLAMAALIDDRVTPTIIADLHHVGAPALQLAFAATPRLALITDAVAPGAGASGGIQIFEHDGAAFLADGTLAGAVIHMIDAVRNAVDLGVSFERVADMAATTPADLLGLASLGRLSVGAQADLVVIGRADHAIREVWLNGARVAR